jgi:hypothetical protein
VPLIACLRRRSLSNARALLTRAAVTITGIIWMRYSLAIVPVNYNLFAVNAAMAVTGSYQLSRKVQADYGLGISA